MMDSSPRPMPQIVLRAYRKNLQLQKLLLSEAFSLQQRVEVRDELLRQLLKKYGSADVFMEIPSSRQVIFRKFMAKRTSTQQASKR